jgi:single-stranded DNA-binding protein
LQGNAPQPPILGWILTLSIGVGAGQGEPPEWVSISIFEPVLSEVPDGLTTGERCYAEGKLKLNRWTTKSGEPRANLQLTASRFLALDRIGKRRRPSRLKAKKGEASGELNEAMHCPMTDISQDALIPF